MRYNPFDHAVGPQRLAAAWAICAILLAAAFGPSIFFGHDAMHEPLARLDREKMAGLALTSLPSIAAVKPQPGEAALALIASGTGG